MANPVYNGQTRRSLLVSYEPEDVLAMDMNNPPGLWANVVVDARSVPSGEDPGSFGQETTHGDLTFIPKATVDVIEAAGQSNKSRNGTSPTGIPKEVDDLTASDRQLVTYGIDADSVKLADGSWVLHPNAGEDLMVSRFDVYDNVLADQWVAQHIEHSKFRNYDDVTLDPAVFAELDAAYEKEAVAWEGTLSDLNHESAEPAREIIAEPRSREDELFAQQLALIAFAETTADFSREDLLAQAEHSEGWEGLNASQFMAVAGAMKFMREAEGPVEARGPEQEPGKVKPGWNLRVPALDKMKSGVSSMIKYCRDADFRKEVNSSLRKDAPAQESVDLGGFDVEEIPDATPGEPRVRFGDKMRNAFANVKAKAEAEASGLRFRVKAKVKAAYEGVHRTGEAIKAGFDKGVDAAQQKIVEVKDRTVEAAVAAKDATVSGVTAARDATVAAAVSTKESVVNAAKEGVARGSEVLADGIEAVNNAPKRLRGFADNVRGVHTAQPVDPDFDMDDVIVVDDTPASKRASETFVQPVARVTDQRAKKKAVIVSHDAALLDKSAGLLQSQVGSSFER